MSVTPRLLYAGVNTAISPVFFTLSIPTAHRLHGKRRTQPHLRERSDNIISKTFQGSNDFLFEHRLGSWQTVKDNEDNRNSPQLTLLVGHGLILYLSSENIIFDGRRCLAASAKRRRVSVDHCLTVQLQLPSFDQYFILVGQWQESGLICAPTGWTHFINYFKNP